MKPQDSSPTRIAAAPPVIHPTLRESKPAEIAIAFPDNATASVVFGHYDQNIARIERSLGVSAYANGNQVVIKGPREASEQARRVFEMLYERVKLGQPASEGDVEGVIAESAYQGLLFPGDDASKDSFGIVKTRKRGVVRARSAAQDHYLAALRKHELVFAEGPAGTGKTWLAVGHAVSLLEQGLVERWEAFAGGMEIANAWCCRAPRSRPASGSVSCPAICATRSIPTCARSMTRSTISWMGGWSSAAFKPA